MYYASCVFLLLFSLFSSASIGTSNEDAKRKLANEECAQRDIADIHEVVRVEICLVRAKPGLNPENDLVVAVRRTITNITNETLVVRAQGGNLRQQSQIYIYLNGELFTEEFVMPAVDSPIQPPATVVYELAPGERKVVRYEISELLAKPLTRNAGYKLSTAGARSYRKSSESTAPGASWPREKRQPRPPLFGMFDNVRLM